MADRQERDSSLENDGKTRATIRDTKLRLEGKTVVLPKVGPVTLGEPLRWPGKIMGASVSREAKHWFLAVQVEVPEQVARLRRSGDDITGVDLGVNAAATLSSGEQIPAPRPDGSGQEQNDAHFRAHF